MRRRRGGALQGSALALRCLAHGSLLAPLLLLCAVSAVAVPAFAGGLPTDGQVVSGKGQIKQLGDTTTIHQASQRLGLTWNSFDIGVGHTVNFEQPGASSIAINRVRGGSASQIFGNLAANGQVWLINPNGVLFGPSAQVNVGGLVASTLDTDSPLDTDTLHFTGKGGKVTNLGHITAADGGYVALLGGKVVNQGVIRARLGTVALGAGTAMTLTFADHRLLHLQVDRSTIQSLVDNRALVVANGGAVLMTAGARDSLMASAVNNTGVVEARTVEDHNGVIKLLGGAKAGSVRVAGTLDASAPAGGKGGLVETSAAKVEVAVGARVTTRAPRGHDGSWLIDPKDFDIGGANQDISAAALGANLNTGNVSISSSDGHTGTAGDINVNDAVTWSSGNTLTLTASNDVNLNAALSGGAGSGVVISAKGIVNAAGANALGSRWRAYTQNPGNDTLDGLIPDFIQYHATLGTTLQGTGDKALVYSQAPTLAITGLTGTVSKTYDGGTTASFTGANFTASGLQSGDTIAAATGGTYATPDAGSGIKVTAPAAIGDFTIEHAGVSVYGYQLGAAPQPALIGQIQPRQLTAEIVGNPTKFYNGTTTATLSAANYQINGFVAGQGATVNQPTSVAYAAPDAGSQPVNATFSVTNFIATGSTRLSNYILPTTATGPGTVKQAPLLITGLLATSKVYDGTTADTLNTSGSRLFGVIAGDAGQVALDKRGMVGAFAQANVGSDIGVSVHGYTLSGAKAGDYKVVAPGGLTANISPKTLTVTDVTAANKEYDATTAATLDTGSAVLNGVVPGDDVTLNSGGATGQFPQVDVGNDLTVTTGGFALDGSASGDYQLVDPRPVANITPRLLHIAITGDPEKDYDGTDAILLGPNNFAITGFVDGQSATVPQSTAHYASANAGTGINIDAKLQPSDFAPAAGTAMSNYTFNSVVVGQGTIDPLQLSGQIIGNPSKVYDGGTGATLSASNFHLVGFLPGQNATASFAGTVAGSYSDPNAGVRTVTAAGPPAGDFAAAGGTLLSNYALPASFTGSGTIEPKPLSGSENPDGKPEIDGTISDVSKVYDGNTSIALSGANFTLHGFVGGDSAQVKSSADISGTFGQADVGTGIPVSATLTGSDLTWSRGDPNNYVLQPLALGTGDITPRPLTVSITGDPTKVYNGSTSAAVSPANFAISGWAAGEGGTVFPTATMQYDSADAGARTVTANLVPGNYKPNAGTKMFNYTLDYVAKGPGTITEAPLFVTNVYADNKTYDATTGATLDTASAGLAGLVSGDEADVKLTVAAMGGTFASKNVGTWAVTANAGDFTIGGSKAANYGLQPVTGLAATITPKDLTLSGIGAADKFYDGTRSATLTGIGSAKLNGVLGADAVGFDGSGATGTFVTSNAVSDIAVAVSGFTLTGADAGNYGLSQPSDIIASIKPAPVTVRIIGTPTKTYDGSDSATLHNSDYEIDGFIFGQGATLPQSATAHYAQADVGQHLNIDSTLEPSDFHADPGTDLANYALPTDGSGHEGVILPVVINLSGSRVYDGTTAAAAALFGNGGALAGVNSETVSLQGSGQVSAKNVGKYTSATSPGDFTLGTLALADGGNGGKAGNYTLVGGTDTLTITPRPLTATFTAENKNYDGTTMAAVDHAALQPDNDAGAGLVASDSVTLVDPTEGTFASKNAGTWTVTGDMSIGGSDAGNYLFTNGTATADISPLAITVGLTGQRQYDGTTNAYGKDFADVATGVSGETLSVTGSGQVANKDVLFGGNTGPTAQDVIDLNDLAFGNGTNGGLAGNYTVTIDSAKYTINPFQKTFAASRVYDGTPDAAYSLFTGSPSNDLATGINGEVLDLSGTGTVPSKDASTSKQPVTDLTLADGSGANAGIATNYDLAYMLQINKRPLTISLNGATGTGDPLSPGPGHRYTKGYDGNATYSAANNGHGLTPGDYSFGTGVANQGFVVGEGATITQTVGTFNSPNVADAHSLTAMLATGDFTAAAGTNLSNYVLPTQAVGEASITPKDLSLGGVNLTGTRQYDDTNVAHNVDFGTDGVITTSGGKVLGVAGSGTVANSEVLFDGNTVPTAQNVVLGTLSLQNGPAGPNQGLASNYALTGGQLTITPKVLDLDGTRVYDGTPNAAAGLFGNQDGTINGIGGQTLTLTGQGQVASKNVRTYSATNDPSVFDWSGLTVGDHGGAAASNYTLAGGTDTLRITPLQLTATADPVDRSYNGTKDVDLVNSVLSGVLPGDAGVIGLGDATNGTVSNPDAGDGKPVTTAMTLTGNGDGNYTLRQPMDLTVNIAPAILNLTGTRAYNGAADAAAAVFGNHDGTINGVNSETLALTGAGTVASKNVGTYTNTSTPSGFTLGTLALANGGHGGNAANYTLVGGADTLTITPKILGLKGTRGYDGSKDAAAALFGNRDGTVNGVGSETLALTGVGTIASKNVGAYTSTTDPSGFALGTLHLGDGDNGGVASNYILVGGPDTLTVTAAPLTISTADVTKTYDGNTTANGSPIVTAGQLFDGDELDHDGTFAFTSSAAGAGDKTVTVAGVTVDDGNGGKNYAVTYLDNTTSTIKKAPLKITANDATKAYGDTLSFAGTEFIPTGLVHSERIGRVDLASTGASATAGAAGGPYAITAKNATGGTFDSHNYSITYVDGALTVTPAPLTITANDATKTYGDTLAFNGTEFTAAGLKNGETIGSAALGSPGADALASVTGGPYVIHAKDAGGGSFDPHNYTITYADGALNVDPTQLTASVVGDPMKVYDGTDTAALTPGNYRLGGFVGGQGASVSQVAGTYNSADVGSATTITAVLGGGDFVADTGTDLSNYVLPTQAIGKGGITPFVLNLAGTRTYDGARDAAAALFGNQNGTIDGIGSETLTLGGWASVASENVGTYTNTTIPSDFALGSLVLGNGGHGGKASNYTLVGGADALTITPRHIAAGALVAAGRDKVYDASDLDPGATVSSPDVVAGDQVNFAFEAIFDDVGGVPNTGKNVGTDKAVTVTIHSATLTGADASNYVLDGAPPTLSTTASITPRALDLTGMRRFDGGRSAEAGLFGNRNGTIDGVAGETLTLTGSGVVANSLAGTYGNGKWPPAFVLGTLALGNGRAGGLASNYTLAGAVDTLTIVAGGAADFGISDGTLASITGFPGQWDRIATPYGLAPRTTVGPVAGNHRRRHRVIEPNWTLDQFRSDLGLRVIDGGVRLPASGH